MLEALFSICVAISVIGCLFLFACASADLLDQIVRHAVRDEFRRRDERCRLRDLNDTPKPDSVA
jgi:hypothetical protein